MKICFGILISCAAKAGFMTIWPREEKSIDFQNYIDGMVYYNYRDGKFYRKSGKQFLPIQQPES